MKYDTFTRSYVETALWSETDDSGQPLDHEYTVADIAPAALERIKSDCAKFQAENADDITDDKQAGNDFWLTRNRHGAGFWDGDWPEPAATRLTNAAHAFGQASLIIGDDDSIHHFPA